MRIVVSEQYDGMLLRDHLRDVLGMSHRLLVRVKNAENGIMLNGSRVTVRARLSAGDVLELKLEDERADENPYLEPVQIDFGLLYEDDQIVVASKPAGMPTHTTHGHYTDSLANALCARYREQGRPFVFRAVNRLDRETSGAVVVSRDKLSAQRLSLALQGGEIKKAYVSIVHGRLEGEGSICGYMKRCGDSIITRTVCQREEPGAVFAHTEYRSVFTDGENSVVVASPITGRTHQLRVHFASIGHPIIGDTLYGDASPVIGRTALHAFGMSFPHPMTSERLDIVAPVAEDIGRAACLLGLPCSALETEELVRQASFLERRAGSSEGGAI